MLSGTIQRTLGDGEVLFTRRGARSPLLALLFFAPILLVPHAQCASFALSGRELQGTITVTIDKDATWQDDGDATPSTQRIHRKARHQVKFNMKDARPDTAAQGMTIYPGLEVSFSASVNDSVDKQVRKEATPAAVPGEATLRWAPQSAQKAW